jgi:hypothetical protein
MVPVYSERLRAALDMSGSSVSDVGRQLKEHQQTLAYLASGSGVKRCRQSRRAGLAKALIVPEEWLGGEATVIPSISFLPPGFEYLYSARTELATSRLMTKCVKACKRDLADPSLLDADVVETAPQAVVPKFVTSFVGELLKVGEWRKQLLVGQSPELIGLAPMLEDPFAQPLKPPKDPDHEDATLGLIRAVEHVLGPWFTGKARLNYRQLRERAGYQTPMGNPRSDTNPYAVIPTKVEKGGVPI